MTLVMTMTACGGGVALDINEPVATTIAQLTPGEETVRPIFPSGTTMDDIQDSGVLRVGVPTDKLGFGLRDREGRIEGFAVEIARLVAAGLFGGTTADFQGRLELVPATTLDAPELVRTGNADFVVAAGPLDRKRVDTAGPWVIATQDVVVRATARGLSDDTEIRSASDLNGKRVCTLSGQPLERLQAVAPGAQIAVAQDIEGCGDALVSRRFDALTAPAPEAGKLTLSDPTVFRLLKAPFGEEPWHLAVRRGDRGLRDFLDTRLSEIFRNGAWGDAYDDTLGVLGLEVPRPPALDRPPKPPVARRPGTTSRPRSTSTTGGATSTTVRRTTSTTDGEATTTSTRLTTTTTEPPRTTTTLLPRP